NETMAFVRPRLNDYYRLAFTQESVDFAIPFLDEDSPLYVDPFLLWKSPSQQDNALHTSIVASTNHIGQLANKGKTDEAVRTFVRLSECAEVGMGSARNKQGKRIGETTAIEIVDLYRKIPDIKNGGLAHIEEIQLLVDQVSKDRVSDVPCSLMKSFLVDYTIDQCARLNIPMVYLELELFNFKKKAFCHARP